MTPDALIRDNIYQISECGNGPEKTNKQYTKEFKEEAVALVRDKAYAVSEASVLLGIASNMLYRWKGEIASNPERKSLLTDERKGLSQLRKEVKNSRMEKEV
ncbi:MAG: transposase [Chitinophagales bacterium]|jgi:transposase